MGFQFNQKQKDAIRDALEMRVKECSKLEKEMSELETAVGNKLALTFKTTGERAEATLHAIDMAEANGEW